jgi:hypothetical protein
MKPFRFKKHHRKSMNVNVIVISEEEMTTMPSGWKYDVPLPPPFIKPHLPHRFFSKVTRPQHAGRVELSF